MKRNISYCISLNICYKYLWQISFWYLYASYSKMSRKFSTNPLCFMTFVATRIVNPKRIYFVQLMLAISFLHQWLVASVKPRSWYMYRSIFRCQCGALHKLVYEVYKQGTLSRFPLGIERNAESEKTTTYLPWKIVPIIVDATIMSEPSCQHHSIPENH